MEENKQTQSESQTIAAGAEASLPTPTPTQIVIDGKNLPTNASSTNVKRKKIAIGTVIAIVALTPIAIFILAMFGSYRDYHNLEVVANQRAQTLTSIIDNGTQADPVVNGDYITASRNPDDSSWSVMKYNVDNVALNTLEPELYIKMSDAGYVRQGGDKQPYYVLSNSYYSNGGESYITMRYTNSDTNEAIKVRYWLTDKYSCPANYVCENTSATSQKNKNVYPIAGFGDLAVAKVDITLADTSNDYATGIEL